MMHSWALIDGTAILCRCTMWIAEGHMWRRGKLWRTSCRTFFILMAQVLCDYGVLRICCQPLRMWRCPDVLVPWE